MSSSAPSLQGPPDAGRLALAARALGHPTRLALLAMLADGKGCCCGEMCARLPLAQSTVSQHLDELRRAGLIVRAAEGSRSLYTLDRSALGRLAEAIGDLAGRTD